MLQKSILNKPKWGEHKQSLEGYGAPGPTVATTLATSTKNDSPVANFVKSQWKTTKPYRYFEPGQQIQT